MSLLLCGDNFYHRLWFEGKKKVQVFIHRLEPALSTQAKRRVSGVNNAQVPATVQEMQPDPLLDPDWRSPDSYGNLASWH